ncbi:response regulator [Patescibacteria group bacterium]|nr:response regulator [Patescibacteria group bacterium]
MQNQQNNQSLKDSPVVLLIEDDPVLTKMYTEKFTSEGLKVLTAQDGETGLEMALTNKIDVILLDIMLPRMSGTDLLEKLRKDDRGKNIPVIALTNLVDQAERDRAMKLGVKGYLVKAMQNPGDVVKKIRESIKS